MAEIDTTGKMVGMTMDILSGKLNVTFQIDTKPLDDLNSLSKIETLDITAKKHRRKRSLDANAYAWVLMQKIAEKSNTDKWSVYLECLRNYSKAFTHVIVKPDAVDKMKEMYRTSIDLGEITVNGMSGHQLQVYFGSSTFDTEEMSVFIEGIVQECKDLKIETIPPAELKRMVSMWQSG